MEYQDYYQILRVSENATLKEIKTAFRRLARDCHPDLHPNDAHATERFRLLKEAYEVLSDQQKRQQYDRSRKKPFDNTNVKQQQPPNQPPNNPQVLYVRGVEKIQARDYWGAIMVLSEAIQLNGYFIEAYLKRCQAYIAVFKDLDALKDCQQILNIQPDNPFAYYYRGRARQRLGYADSAVRCYTKAIRLKPDFAPSYYYRGVAYYELGNRAHAIADWENYTEICRQQGDEKGYRLGIDTLTRYSWLYFGRRTLEGLWYRPGQPKTLYYYYAILIQQLQTLLSQLNITLKVGINVLSQVWSNPVKGLLSAYSRINYNMTIKVSIALVALATSAITLGLLPHLEGGWGRIIPLMVLGLIPTASMGLVSLMIRLLLPYHRDWTIDLFMASNAILPIAGLVLIWGLLPNVLLVQVLLVILGIFTVSQTILLLYGGCTQLLNVSESLAALMVPTMILTGILFTLLGMSLILT